MLCFRGFGSILIALLADSVSAFLFLGKRWGKPLSRHVSNADVSIKKRNNASRKDVPSTTDFRIRIPTLRREVWIVAGKIGPWGVALVSM